MLLNDSTSWSSVESASLHTGISSSSEGVSDNSLIISAVRSSSSSSSALDCAHSVLLEPLLRRRGVESANSLLHELLFTILGLCWSSSLLNHGLRLIDGSVDACLNLIELLLSIKVSSHDVISLDKRIQFFLQVFVLLSQKSRMLL